MQSIQESSRARSTSRVSNAARFVVRQVAGPARAPPCKPPFVKMILDKLLTDEVGDFGRFQMKTLAVSLVLMIFTGVANSNFKFKTAQIPIRFLVRHREWKPKKEEKLPPSLDPYVTRQGITFKYLQLYLFMATKCALATVLTSVYLYTAELYPTSDRHKLLALAAVFGRVGSTCVPLTPILAAEQFADLLYMTSGSMALLSGVTIFFTPEILGTTLPDNFDQAENLGRKIEN